MTELVHWYNHEHRHSAIRFITPTQRHASLDQPLLTQRAAVYAAAREKNPRRWTGASRNWCPVGDVHLNPSTPKNKDSTTDLKAA